MASFSRRPIEAAREDTSDSYSQPHTLKEIGEQSPGQYIPHTSGSGVENQQGVRTGPHSHMGPGTHVMNPPFQQMAEFFHRMAETIYDPHGLNFEKMRKMGRVEFEGTVDPTDAEQWLERIERVFEQLECSDIAKFKYDISLLQKDAYDWWVSVPNAKAKPPVLTWDDFVKEFRMKRFEDGLNDSIRKNVAIMQHENFCKLVSAAFTWEKLDKKEASRHDNRFRKPRSDFGSPSKKGRFDDSKAGSVNKSNQLKQNRLDFSTASTPSYSQGKTRVPTCAECGKNHYGVCRRASGACFNCGSFDHKVKDCPNPNNVPLFHTEGSIQKSSNNPSQINRGAKPKNNQTAGQVEQIKLAGPELLHGLML
ncbi:uncharacterized protein LOC129900054 [Solanum dulcamara]|uniref:uncharacterized protein LOC129900054 n=1 Tax=Solanum dulcamara TaxID=45834 RepID=UPI0024855F01|nr:uncharacterized protein LOC129900054 [Solanum dulcamara]